MKKTLIAIAAIAAMGAASAEVTLYGKLDAGVGVTTNDAKNANGTKVSPDQGAQFGSGNYETSRIGVKGSSDIANGIKGMFVLEGKLGATDGDFSDFGRQAYLGLSGGFGTVSVGRMWTPYDNAFNDALEYNGFSAMGSAFYGGAHGDNGMDGSGASKNAFQYTTPTFGGLSAVILYGSNGDAESTTTGDKSATNYTSLGVNYANGPLSVNLATEKVKTSLHIGEGIGIARDAYTNAWILAGSYNLGVATVFAAAEGASADTGVSGISSLKDSGTSFGVSVPVNKATTAALSYATETTTVEKASDGKTTSVGMQVVYAWNAATAIYAGYRKTDTTGLAAVGTPQTTTTASKFATGVRYNF
jgi:predicted porin